MSKLFVARRKNRRGLLLTPQAKGMILFPLDQTDRSELDELVRAILAKQGITNEAEIQAIVERAEMDSEIRIKVAEVKAEVRRLMSLKAKGAKLMQVGFRKWKQVFYPAVKRYTGGN